MRTSLMLTLLLPATSAFGANIPRQDAATTTGSDEPPAAIPCPATPGNCAERLNGHLICLNARTWCLYTDATHYTPAFFPVDLESPPPDADANLDMPRGALDSEDARLAQAEAVRGAGVGALKWGAAAAALAGLGYAVSPVYRGLTVQFKVYLQMSGMILGGMIEGDARMRRYEHHVRTQRMIARDRAMWRDLEEDMPSPPPSASKK
ncbi:hypothetical protein F5Y14DRAFT_451755 [Nemania sp. NC0429]|nr:hypothetical protein F5Y14DRAFT_451755 [Nemania sp. NC0429]